MSGFVDIIINDPTPRSITVTMEQALSMTQSFVHAENIQVLTNPSFRGLLVEAVDTREDMECTYAYEDEVPDLISDDLISSVHARVVEIEMENVEQPENLSEYQRLD